MSVINEPRSRATSSNPTQLQPNISSIPLPSIHEQLPSGFAEADANEDAGGVSYDPEILPRGWPSWAYEQDLHESNSVHRRFGWLSQRVLHYDQVRIAALEKKLKDMDTKDEERDPSLLVVPSACQLREGEFVISEKDHLIETIAIHLHRYYRSLYWHREVVKRLPLVTRSEHKYLRKHAKDHGIRTEKALLFLKPPDDFVSTDTETISRIVARCTYFLQEDLKILLKRKADEWGKRAKAWPTTFRQSFSRISRNFGRNHDSQQTSRSADSQGVDMLPLGRLRRILNISVVGACLAVLIAPVVILYLCNLSKPASIGVVVAFAAIFIVGISNVPGAKTDVTLVGASAYLAVLVTFIANLQNNACQQGT